MREVEARVFQIVPVDSDSECDSIRPVHTETSPGDSPRGPRPTGHKHLWGENTKNECVCVGSILGPLPRPL